MALIEVTIATATPTLRSSSSGNDTRLMENASTANRKPTMLPTMIRLVPFRRGQDLADELPKATGCSSKPKLAM